MLDSVKVPQQFEPIFQKAQEYVSRYFKERINDPTKGTIEIFSERYILIRAASMSVEFYETIMNLYQKEGEEEAMNVARQLLFDIAHAIGRQDAKNFHMKMGMEDPIEKLSAGPVHFAYSGWAFVDIFAESKPSPDENYYLIYDHPFSFESDAWIKAGKKSNFPVCVMNAGYSSGWCEESFGIKLVASEIMCKAKGDDVCRFIMAPPSKIEGYIQEYIKQKPELAKKITKYEIPGFFKRKQMEDELRKSEQEHQDILENINDLIQSVAPDGSFIYVNRSWMNTLGYTKEEVPSLSMFDIIHPDSREHCKKIFERVLNREEVKNIEAKFLTKDGREILVEGSSNCRFVNGKPVATRAIFSDVTGRKRAEERLRNREEKFRDFANSLPETVCQIDERGNLIFVNKMGFEVFGYSQEDFEEGLNVIQMVAPKDHDRVKDNMRKILAGENIGGMRYIFRKKDGTQFPVAVYSKVILLNGRPMGMTAIVIDDTERKKEEESLSESEQRFRTIYDNAMDGIILADMETKKFYTGNKMICQMLGYNLEEISNMGVMDIHPEKDIPYVIEQYEKQSKKEITLARDIPVKRKDGSVFYADINSNRVVLKGKTYLMGIFRDVTDSRKT